MLIEDAFTEGSCGAFEDTSGDEAVNKQPEGIFDIGEGLMGNIWRELAL